MRIENLLRYGSGAFLMTCSKPRQKRVWSFNVSKDVAATAAHCRGWNTEIQSSKVVWWADVQARPCMQRRPPGLPPPIPGATSFFTTLSSLGQAVPEAVSTFLVHAPASSAINPLFKTR